MRNSFNLRFPHRLEGIHELSENCMQHFEFMQFFWEKSLKILSGCQRCLWLRFPKFENHCFTVLSELSNFDLKKDVRIILDSQRVASTVQKKPPYSFTQIHQLLTFLSLSHTCTPKHTFSLFLNHLTTSFRPDSTSPLNTLRCISLNEDPQEVEKSITIQRCHSKNLFKFQFCQLSWKCLFWSSTPGFWYIVISCHVSSASSNLELFLSHSLYHVLESLREYRHVDWHSTWFHRMCPYSQTQACIPDKLRFFHYVSLSHSWWR